MSFADLGVPANLVERLNAQGITEAFPIQEAALPDALAGRDVVGKAVTGSGKTLAFGLPLMARLGKARPRKPLGLVLVPTRELAAQVQKELANLTDDRGRRVICIYGGTSYNVARKALNFGVDVVVACPGRLEDMLEQGALDLSSITTVVVDEADRMADMGFLPSVRRIIGATPQNRHVMLFSATMGPDVKSLVKEFTNDAAIHDVVGEEAPNDVDHYFWRVPRDQRPQITADIIAEYDRAIIFTRTKHGADRLARQLEERGISAVPLHGDRTQAQRERALRSVKSGQIRVLVATDVAARGIDALGFRCNRDTSDLFANGQFWIERAHLVAFEFDIRLQPGLEPGRLHFGAIYAQGQVSDVDVSLAVGYSGRLHLRVLVCDGNLRAGDRSSGRIDYGRFESALELSRRRSERENCEDKERENANNKGSGRRQHRGSSF